MKENKKDKVSDLISDVYDVNKTLVMGILNATPDSFFSDSRCLNENEIVSRVSTMLAEGASIIDIGGCSTRPGGILTSEEEELRRVDHALQCVRKVYPSIALSVDTFRSSVARMAVEDFDVSIINDVYSYDKDVRMLDTIASLNVAYVLTHSREINSDCCDFMKEIFCFFADKIKELKEKGVERIYVDPGYGFGKTMEQNFQLLARQLELKSFGYPILAGLSRKRMVWQTLGITPEESLNGTSVLNTLAVRQGASLLRVHDVKAAVEVVRLTSSCTY